MSEIDLPSLLYRISEQKISMNQAISITNEIKKSILSGRQKEEYDDLIKEKLDEYDRWIKECLR